MSEQQADVRLKLGGGSFPSTSYGAPAPLLHGEITIPGVGITFSHPFCSKHPGEALGGIFGCAKCMTETQSVIKDLLDSPHPGASIDCENINHTHECKCHLGHQCDSDCHIYQSLITDQEKASQEVHPLFRVAAEAPSEVMRGVYERLNQLEQDNAALKNLVTKILGVLPEEPRNEAVMGAIREKLGISEAVGSTEGVEEA